MPSETSASFVVKHHAQKYLGAFLSDDQARALWREVRTHLVSSGLAQTVEEIEGEGGPSLDTLPRSDLLEAFGRVLAQRPWPCNADSTEEFEAFRHEMAAAMARRGYARGKQEAAPLGAQEAQVFEILAVHPKGANERKHSSRVYQVHAFSESEALALVENTGALPRGSHLAALSCKPFVGQRILSSAAGGALDAAEVRRLKGQPEPAPPAQMGKEALARKPLSETQDLVLRSLSAHGKYPAGWVWGSASATERTLHSMHRRGLVELQAGVFTLSAAGRALLVINKGAD